VSKMKIAGFAALGFVLAVIAGYLWGSAGRWTAEAALADADARWYLQSARTSLLGGRVGIYSLNFGDAARRLEAAKNEAGLAADRLERAGRTEPAARIKAVIPTIEDSRALAASLNQDANSRAASADAVIDEVLRAELARAAAAGTRP
jgi:hypothetical protein